MNVGWALKSVRVGDCSARPSDSGLHGRRHSFGPNACSNASKCWSQSRVRCLVIAATPLLTLHTQARNSKHTEHASDQHVGRGLVTFGVMRYKNSFCLLQHAYGRCMHMVDVPTHAHSLEHNVTYLFNRQWMLRVDKLV